MRCILCDAEMILMNVVQDDTMPVVGFERRTFMCSSCHDVEQRLAFVRPVDETNVEAMPSSEAPPIADHQTSEEQMHPASAPSIAPTSEVQNEAAGAVRDEQSVAIEHEPAPSLLWRVVTMMRARP